MDDHSLVVEPSMRTFGIVIGLLVLLSATDLASAQSSRIDPAKARKVEVVLRVKLIEVGDCNKYCWPEVEILEVLQNRSSFSFKKRLKVAHYSWKPGIPEGESTIYLERYNSKRTDLWKLLNGSGEDGAQVAFCLDAPVSEMGTYRRHRVRMRSTTSSV